MSDENQKAFKTRLRKLLTQITYKTNWYVVVVNDKAGIYLQLQLQVSNSSGDCSLHGRKWRLSDHMTDSEIIQTAFKAFLTFEEHECREMFEFQGAKVFGPHHDVHDLVFAIKNGAITEDKRK